MLKYDIQEYRVRTRYLAGEYLYNLCMFEIYFEAAEYFWRQGDMNNFYYWRHEYAKIKRALEHNIKLLRHALHYSANLPISFLMVDSNI